ncbi:polyketide synthase [Cellulosilyticum ruminicola]|uniref:polyketide synthase n=1 Tax=Cellulosilyticum ruminicola TaxID=425254 RepID=UPI0009F9FD3E|nr:polyketide synthase [Cellulosilyticum ruminicola]
MDIERFLVQLANRVGERAIKVEELLDENENINFEVIIDRFSLEEICPYIKLEEITPGVMCITINDSINKNTFTMEVTFGLMKAFDLINKNEEIKVAIITGYSSYFACGGNLEGMEAVYDGEIELTDINVFKLPLECNVPVIAAMQGHALGSGLCFGLFCDFVVLSKESYYSCNHMSYGFTPGEGATLILPMKFGKLLGEEMLFSGRRYRGSELESRNVQCPVVPRKEVIDRALNLAKQLVSKPRKSLILLKDYITSDLRKNLDRVIKEEWELQKKTLVKNNEVISKVKGNFRFAEYKNVNSKKSYLVKLNNQKQGKPIFWIHGEGGGLEGYQTIANTCTRPFYGIRMSDIGRSEKEFEGIETRAQFYVELIKEIQNEGPYDIGGYSSGGIIAYEVVRLLQQEGKEVKTLFMIDTPSIQYLKDNELSIKEKMLLGVNMALIARSRGKTTNFSDVIIRSKDVQNNITDEEYLKKLIELGYQKGLNKNINSSQMYEMFLSGVMGNNNLNEAQFNLKKLKDDEHITCCYIKNTVIDGDKKEIDYWSEWKGLFKHFNQIDTQSISEATVIFESDVIEKIVACCEQVY